MSVSARGGAVAASRPAALAARPSVGARAAPVGAGRASAALGLASRGALRLPLVASSRPLEGARSPRISPLGALASPRAALPALPARRASRSAGSRPLSRPCRATGPGGADDARPSSSSAAAAPSSSLASTLGLGCLFGLWYLFNIYFNIFNKRVLKSYPYPLTVTALQFLVGSGIALASWAFRVQSLPPLGAALSASPLALVHALGNALTNVSLGAVAVSFTHTIKALEPLFSVLLSALFLGQPPTAPVVLSLVPVVLGVSLASSGELGFNWTGFLAAMGSNLTFQSRNVLSKKVLSVDRGALDNVNLFSVITVVSCVVLAPIALLVERPPLTQAALDAARAAAGVAPAKLLSGTSLLREALLAAVCFHAYQQVSFSILARVTPVTHAVGNCVKRVVVILASLVVFRNPLTLRSAAGTAIALSGVFGYSAAKRIGNKKEADTKAKTQ